MVTYTRRGEFERMSTPLHSEHWLKIKQAAERAVRELLAVQAATPPLPSAARTATEVYTRLRQAEWTTAALTHASLETARAALLQPQMPPCTTDRSEHLPDDTLLPLDQWNAKVDALFVACGLEETTHP